MAFPLVQSGVPHGTVLGPLMFLLYINDISNNIHSPLCLFADDCLLYRVINTEQDALQLQQDLNTLFGWVETWQLKFNTSKCSTLRFTRRHSLSTINFMIPSYPLQINIFILDNKLSWSLHISRTTSKATRALNFLKQNLSNCSTEVKAAAYVSMVHPTMKYAAAAAAAAVWDPHYVRGYPSTREGAAKSR